MPNPNSRTLYNHREARPDETPVDVGSITTEGLTDVIGQKLDGVVDWLDLKVDNIYTHALDLVGKGEKYDDILTPAMRADLKVVVPTMRLSLYSKVLIMVPHHLKTNFTDYSITVLSSSNDVDKYVDSALDKLEIILSSVASGHNLEGTVYLQQDLDKVAEIKETYVKATGKYLSDKDNTRLFVTQAYSNSSDILSAFDNLRGYHDILEASKLSTMVNKTRNLSRIFKLIDKEKLDRSTLVILMDAIQGCAESLEFVALVVNDTMSCVASCKAHVEEFTK